MRLSEKIPMLVRMRGTTQADLARAIGTYPQRVSEWVAEKGSPSIKQALRMARALDVTLDYLVDDAQDDPATSTEWERRIAEIVAVIGPERAWRKLVGADQPSVVPKLIPPPGKPGISREEAG